MKLPGATIDWAHTKYAPSEMADLTAKIEAGGAAAEYAAQKIADDHRLASEPPRARTAAEFEELHERVASGAASPAEVMVYNNSDPRILIRRPGPAPVARKPVALPGGAQTGAQFRELHAKVCTGQASPAEVAMYNASNPQIAMRD